MLTISKDLGKFGNVGVGNSYGIIPVQLKITVYPGDTTHLTLEKPTDPNGMHPAVGGTVSGVRQVIDVLSDRMTARASLVTNMIVSAIDVVDAALNGSMLDVGRQSSGFVGGIVGSVALAGLTIGVGAALAATTALTPFAGLVVGLATIGSVISSVVGAIYGRKLGGFLFDAGMRNRTFSVRGVKFIKSWLVQISCIDKVILTSSTRDTMRILAAQLLWRSPSVLDV